MWCCMFERECIVDCSQTMFYLDSLGHDVSFSGYGPKIQLGIPPTLFHVAILRQGSEPSDEDNLVWMAEIMQ